MISRSAFITRCLLFVVLLITSILSMTTVAVRADEPIQAQAAPTLGGCPVLPADNIWNTPVDNLPIHSNSTDYIDTIGAGSNVHADFGSGEWPPGSGAKIGIPYVVVPSTQTLVTINISPYDDESDPGPYPVPANAPIEGAPLTGGDRHVLVVRQGECKLYELYRAFPNGDGSWDAESGAVYNLNSNNLRPAGWTSADAAGLPILPGLVRYEEVAAGEINHALRFTAPQTRNAYVWPARHFASDLTGSQYPPMGQRFRLRANFDISGYSPEAQVILVALKKYGMILADNGSPWYISGAPSESWDNDILHELDDVYGSDFEAVDVSSLMVSSNSGQVKGFNLSASPAIRAIEAGSSTNYLLTLSNSGNFTSSVALNATNPELDIDLSPSSVITPPGLITMTVTDQNIPPLTSGLWYSIPIVATGGGFTRTATVNLLVGGAEIYLPMIRKGN
jgi:hypothetical protein